MTEPVTSEVATPARVAVVVFDAYGTLLDVNSAVAAIAGSLGPKAAALSELWRRKQLEYTWLRSLMRDHRDFAAITADALDYALETLQLDAAQLRAPLLGAYRRLSPYPEARAALERLRAAGKRLAVLSNGEPQMLAEGLEHAGLAPLLDAVLSVEEVGIFKPAPEVYLLATRRFGVPGREVGFVSSNGWDVHGAALFGFRVAWVNRAGAARERLPAEPIAVIHDLSGLSEIFV